MLSLLDGDIGCCDVLVEGDFVLGGGALFSLNTHSIRQPIYRFKPLGKGSESSIFVVVFLSCLMLLLFLSGVFERVVAAGVTICLLISLQHMYCSENEVL